MAICTAADQILGTGSRIHGILPFVIGSCRKKLIYEQRKRENSTQEPRGGILADEMRVLSSSLLSGVTANTIHRGLGKTIMMLTNIVNGKSLQQKKCRTTLIVASPALVSQWRREITAHVYTDKETKHGIGRVKEYHSSAQIKSNQEIEELCECDIVLTTYATLMKSYPKAEIPSELVSAEDKNRWWKAYYEKEKGPLHRIQWHRIVLDEAQAIKNHKSLTSLACRALNGRHCWGISGVRWNLPDDEYDSLLNYTVQTPILNNIGEFYPLFRFIKEPHTGSIKLFRKNFCSDSDPDRQAKLDTFLRKFMIRRTHLDTLFNARLLDLPQPKQMTVKLDFNEIERNVYEIVKSRFVQRINCISKAGELDKQYGHIWTMITRLRQLTSHILLAQSTMTDLLEREDFERLHKIASNDLSEESRALLTHLRFKLKETVEGEVVNNKQMDSREGATILTETETVPNYRAGYDTGTESIGGKHGLKYKFSRYLDDLLNSESWEAIASRTLCCGCRQPPQDPHVTSCVSSRHIQMFCDPKLTILVPHILLLCELQCPDQSGARANRNSACMTCSSPVLDWHRTAIGATSADPTIQKPHAARILWRNSLVHTTPSPAAPRVKSSVSPVRAKSLPCRAGRLCVAKFCPLQRLSPSSARFWSGLKRIRT